TKPEAPARRSSSLALRASSQLRSLRLGELRQPLASQRLPQLQQAARLDLADALAGDAVGPRHLLQGPRLAVAQAEAQLDDLALARGQRSQHLADALAEQMLINRLAGVGGVGVVQEVLQGPL